MLALSVLSAVTFPSISDLGTIFMNILTSLCFSSNYSLSQLLFALLFLGESNVNVRVF